MKCALYCRVSTSEQHPENQKLQLINHAQKEGWEYELFEEKESTRHTRPVKNDLYLRLLKKEFDAVIVVALTRWARSLSELVRDVNALWNKGIKFISLKESIDLSSATGKLQFHMFCAFAEFERDMISERTKEAFYTDENGIKRSIKTNNAVGKSGKDKKRRRKSGYYQRWINKKSGEETLT